MSPVISWMRFWIVFGVISLFLPVKHIIGTHMDEAGARFFCNVRNVNRTIPICRIRLFLAFSFGTVHIGVGSHIENVRRPLFFHKRLDRAFRGNVELRMGSSHPFDPFCGKKKAEVKSEKAAACHNPTFHAVFPKQGRV